MSRPQAIRAGKAAREHAFAAVSVDGYREQAALAVVSVDRYRAQAAGHVIREAYDRLV